MRLGEINQLFDIPGLDEIVQKHASSFANKDLSQHIEASDVALAVKLESGLDGITKFFQSCVTAFINQKNESESDNLAGGAFYAYKLIKELSPSSSLTTQLLPFLEKERYRAIFNKLFPSTEKNEEGVVSVDELERESLNKELISVQKKLSELSILSPPTSLTDSKEWLEEKHALAAEEWKKNPSEVLYPSTWQFTNSDVALIPVALHSDEGLSVIDRFYEGDPRSRQVFEIQSIIRVQNKKIFEHCRISQASIAKKNGGKSNEVSRFHGCAADNIHSTVMDGFDIDKSSCKGIAGVGIYFAKFPRTALSYIRDFPPSEMKVLLCRIELGRQITIPDHQKAYPEASVENPIRSPQPRSETDTTPFDSVSGNLRNDPSHPIDVVYDNYQAFPEYIITFSINKNRIVRGKPPTGIENIKWDHPQYQAQRAETRKSLKFLERTLAFEPNKAMPDYPILERLLALLKEEPTDPDSIHQRENITLQEFQRLVRRYNELCATQPIILLSQNVSEDTLEGDNEKR